VWWWFRVPCWIHHLRCPLAQQALLHRLLLQSMLNRAGLAQCMTLYGPTARLATAICRAAVTCLFSCIALWVTCRSSLRGKMPAGMPTMATAAAAARDLETGSSNSSSRALHQGNRPQPAVVSHVLLLRLRLMRLLPARSSRCCGTGGVAALLLLLLAGAPLGVSRQCINTAAAGAAAGWACLMVCMAPCQLLQGCLVGLCPSSSSQTAR
jgi:hypothetical protein